jgi:CDP-glucose 4,6-dehydratase
MSGFATELRAAYAGKRVFLTGHTGFKGGWLTLWLKELGAEIFGFALPSNTTPSLFEVAGVASVCRNRVGDIRDLRALRAAVREVKPDIVFHLAAQPIVRRSYEAPLDTLETNVVGTANLLEAIRLESLRTTVVIATSDKCYENREWVHGYREIDPMGGHDVYSMSKGAAELVTASWRRSFFNPLKFAEHGVAVATARAGNVIGGGDWAMDRIVPDCVIALTQKLPISVRNPNAVRPWQHVLEPLGGYLVLGARLAKDPKIFGEAFNFGPRPDDAKPVKALVETLIRYWGDGVREDNRDPDAPHEAGLLRLSIDKAYSLLGWAPRWSFDVAIAHTASWYRLQLEGLGVERMRGATLDQIHDYTEMWE